MSIAGGVELALERGRAAGCWAVQIFVKNQRRWAAPALAPDAIRAFAAARRRTGIRHVFSHASYLINLASPDPPAWRRAVDGLADEVERAEALGLACVVVHPGSHLGTGLAGGLALVARALDDVTRRSAGYRVRIALENAAGAGDAIGRRFDELAAILRRVASPERLGVCIDTCHLFAAGYDIRSPAGYARAVEECRAAVGLERVLAVHVNDAKAPLGSGLDRHEHVGRGRLGRTPFRLLVRDAGLRRVPKVLETPKEPEPLADRRNLALLRALRRAGGVSGSS